MSCPICGGDVILGKNNFQQCKNPICVKVFYADGIIADLKPKPPRLASVKEFKSAQFDRFMSCLNQFANAFGLKEITNLSKVWEYPWLWFNSLCGVDLNGKHVVDIGSQRSSMPWLLALMGARVTLVEADAKTLTLWEHLQRELNVDVSWKFSQSELIPLPSGNVDVVCSFSVIEHQPDKALAISEVTRILKPNGIFAVSFDICEPKMGMTFPEWGGKALTLDDFEHFVWNAPGFTINEKPKWNLQDVPDFKAWNLLAAPHHNYVVGAAVLKRTV